MAGEGQTRTFQVVDLPERVRTRLTDSATRIGFCIGCCIFDPLQPDATCLPSADGTPDITLDTASFELLQSRAGGMLSRLTLQSMEAHNLNHHTAHDQHTPILGCMANPAGQSVKDLSPVSATQKMREVTVQLPVLPPTHSHSQPQTGRISRADIAEGKANPWYLEQD